MLVHRISNPAFKICTNKWVCMENQDWQVVVMVLILVTVQEFTAAKVIQRGVGGAMENGDIMGKDKD